MKIKNIRVTTGSSTACSVTGVLWLALEKFSDHRGPLTVLGQGGVPLPFPPKRIFFTYQSSGDLRGQHSHRHCHQILICVAGSMKVRVEDGENMKEFTLSGPEHALYVPPMIWAEQYGHSSDAVLLVLASHAYDDADYIREYEVWKWARVAAAGQK